MNWTTTDIAEQTGKTILVTGANAGLGYHTALELARKGARIVLTGRSAAKLEAAAAALREEVPNALLEIGIVDLASLDSIAAFAGGLSKTVDRIDVLINNAGVMFPPAGKTVDGYETQFGVNFIGHFALTGRLFGLLNPRGGARIVTLSSIAHRRAAIDFDNLKLEKPYDRFREYGQSKLADLIFAIELQRRIERAALDLLSIGAHPGISKTELLRHDNPAMIENFDYMDAAQGALPTLYAAVSPDARGGAYYGPDGEDEINGYPAPAAISADAENAETARRLWAYAESETGIRFP